MRKKLTMIYVISILILTSCAFCDTAKISDTEELDAGIEWISLSYEGNEEKREEIRRYLDKENAFLADRPSAVENATPVAISLYDVNSDGNEEVIAFITHNYLMSARSSGALSVFFYDESGIADETSLPAFPLDIESLNNSYSKQIGLKKNKDNWADLVIRSEDLETESVWSTKPDVY